MIASQAPLMKPFMVCKHPNKKGVAADPYNKIIASNSPITEKDSLTLLCFDLEKARELKLDALRASAIGVIDLEEYQLINTEELADKTPVANLYKLKSLELAINQKNSQSRFDATLAEWNDRFEKIDSALTKQLAVNNELQAAATAQTATNAAQESTIRQLQESATATNAAQDSAIRHLQDTVSYQTEDIRKLKELKEDSTEAIRNLENDIYGQVMRIMEEVKENYAKTKVIAALDVNIEGLIQAASLSEEINFNNVAEINELWSASLHHPRAM